MSGLTSPSRPGSGNAGLVTLATFDNAGGAKVDDLTIVATEAVVGKVLDSADQRRLVEEAVEEALEFKRPGDRLRLNLDGSYTALTLSAWVKVDSVDKKYNSLLLTDGYDNGEPHWQIYEDGSLMFSIIYRPDGITRGGDWNQIYFSKPVFGPDSLGRWHHIAVSYDNQSGQVIQYFDGADVSREVSKPHHAGRPISYGPCELGNWGLPTQGHPFPIRNLNGAIDEFAIYAAVLSGAEIQSIFENGNPK